MVNEGTYPYAMGGVSVWCDQLIRGLSAHEWEVVALTVDGTETSAWERPENLVSIRNIPMWGPHAPLHSRRPGKEFLGPFADLVATLLAPMSDHADTDAQHRQRFVDALHGLYDAAQHEDVPHALTSPAALTLLMDEWNAIYGDGLSLADALQVTILLEHMLRPLFAEPVRADIVHCSMNGLTMLVGMAARWRYGTPVLMSEHGIYLRERYLSYVNDGAPHAVKVLLLSFFRMLAWAGYLVADALAPHSSYNRRWQLRGGASPEIMWTMYNGVQPEDFPPVVDEPESPCIVYMGRIDPIKDLHTLIRSFRLVLDEMPEARLRIFGGTAPDSIAYRDSCQQLVEELGLTGSAFLEGQVDAPVHAYHSSSLVVLSSISEGFPYTVVEAMACQRTVVCTDVGGVKEAVADTGMVVPPRNPEMMAQACLRLLRDDALRHSLATAARQRVLERFTLERALADYLRLYESLGDTAGHTEALQAAHLDLQAWTAIGRRLAQTASAVHS